jgi:hypothetical protein
MASSSWPLLQPKIKNTAPRLITKRVSMAIFSMAVPHQNLNCMITLETPATNFFSAARAHLREFEP